ncbi:MAG: hypothetical protein E6G61_06145 [Actinobacteria bacterium]|nr:MAG: hypothetical protein E6G61_06145 [Actinomycetota bacterium]
MRHLWVRTPHEIAGLTEPPIANALELTASSLKFYASVPPDAPLRPVLASTLGVDPSGLVQADLKTDGNGCHKGDAGTYTFGLTASGLRLMVGNGTDACATRIAAIAGDWIRAACPNAPQWCLGDLDPGPHVSINYTPFVRAPNWHFDYGKFGYTVPEGWTNPEDAADGYVLKRRNGPDGAGIWVFSDVLAHAQGTACAIKPETGVGSSAKAIYRWLRFVPGLRVTAIVEGARLGGLTGYSLDVSIDPTWKDTCPWSEGKPAVPMFLNAQSTADEGLDWGLLGDGRMRLVILPLGPDRALLIDIEAADKAAWDALLPEAMPVVDSFQFHH